MAKQRNVAAAYWLPTDGTDRHRQTDRRTDGRTTERYIDAYDAVGVNKAHAECRACLNVLETVHTQQQVAHVVAVSRGELGAVLEI